MHSEYTLSPKSRPQETHRSTAPGSLTGKLQGKERDGRGRDTDQKGFLNKYQVFVNRQDVVTLLRPKLG